MMVIVRIPGGRTGNPHVDPLPSPNRRGANQVRRHTVDPDEAVQAVAEVFLPNRITLPPRVSTVDMDLVAVRYGALMAGQVTYGREVDIRTADAEEVHINLQLCGRAVMRTGRGSESMVEAGGGAVLHPGAPAHMTWSADTAQLGLMVSQAALEAELARLLGRSLVQPLELDFDLDLHGDLGRAWDPVVKLLLGALHDPGPLPEHPVAARHVEALVLDGLLLGHRHNHRDLLDCPAPAGTPGSIARAVELLEAQPDAAWTTVRLAREVHLSVRALQAGFRRDLDLPPMAYLRQVRLRRVREVLVTATPEATTVRLAATRFGLLHLGRFAAAYREVYGESPVETLRRPPPD
jgi:AraC-like DNA-binding protein